MPYITEEIYQKFFRQNEKEKSIHNTKWPKYYKKSENKKLESTGKEFLAIIKECRIFKTHYNKSLKEEINLILPAKYKRLFDSSLIGDLKSTANASVNFGKELKIELKNGQ